MKLSDQSALESESIDSRLSTLVLETFGQDAYAAAVITANAIGRQTPNDPGAMTVALRDELKRLVGPH